MHESYKKWLEDGRPKVICKCGCNEEIVIKEHHKYDGIPKYIYQHHNRGKHYNQGHIAWNKGLTKETDNRIKLYSEKNTGKNNPMYGRHYSDERKKLSSSPGELNPMFGIHRYGKDAPAFGKKPSSLTSHGKRCYYNSPLQGKICFRSSYELKFAKYLDERDIPWLYEIQTFNLGNMTYTPDFYLPTSNLFVEVKGYMSEYAKNKINKFLDNYIEETLKILYKEDLIKLGIKI